MRSIGPEAAVWQIHCSDLAIERIKAPAPPRGLYMEQSASHACGSEKFSSMRKVAATRRAISSTGGVIPSPKSVA